MSAISDRARQPVPAPELTPTPCPHCAKPAALCVCDSVTPVENRVELVVLQHPQEKDRTLGSARLAVHALTRATFKVGLSWPSLSRMLGREADPARWAVLYLGSANAEKLAPGKAVVILNRKGEPVGDQRGALRDLEGVILLDGTWSQAKALWWRNPWMLKCRRIILGPPRPSRYGSLRKEPRRDGLSTIEAAGFLLARLENAPEIETALTQTFERMLARFREVKRTQPELTRR